jgi:hypothetical protein
VPFGHRTSTESTLVRFPSPTCSRASLCEIAVAASPLGTLDEIRRANRYDSADGVSIACASFERRHEEVLPIPAIVSKDRRRAVQVIDHDVDIAVVITPALPTFV